MDTTHTDNTSLQKVYGQSFDNPDRVYSIVPTVVQISGDVYAKSVTCLGPASADFAYAYADAGASVTCIDQFDVPDNRQKERKDVHIQVANPLTVDLGSVDVLAILWTLDFVKDTASLKAFFTRCYQALNESGRLVLVANMPDDTVRHTYNVRKELLGPREDGTSIKIDFFEDGHYVCSIDSVYFSPSTIREAMREAGFINVRWHDPVVHPSGITEYGQAYWDVYTTMTELAYVTAEK